MAIRLFDVPSLEDEVVIDESVQLDPVEQSETAEQIATAENEIEANLQIAEQSESTMDDLQKQVDANQEVIDEPGESTDEQVEAQVAASQEALKTASLLLSGRVDTFSVSVESASTPMEKLIVSQEGITDWVVAIFQKIVELLVKVGVFLRKLLTHISAWVVSFTPGLSSLAKFYKNKDVSVDLNQVVEEKTPIYYQALSLVQNSPDLAYLPNNAKDLKKYMSNETTWLRDIYSQGEKFVTSRDFKLDVKTDMFYGGNKAGQGEASYGLLNEPSVHGLVKAILRNEVPRQLATLGNKVIPSVSESDGFVTDIKIDTVTNTIYYNIGSFTSNKAVRASTPLPQPLEETTNTLIQNLINIKGNDLATFSESMIKLYKDFPGFVSKAMKGVSEMQKSAEKARDGLFKIFGKTGETKIKHEGKTVGTVDSRAIREQYIKKYVGYYYVTLKFLKFLRQNLKSASRIPYKLKGFYGEPAKQ